jgi:hypothetical protein
MKTRTHHTKLKSAFGTILSMAVLMVFASGGPLFAQSSKEADKKILYEMTIDEVTCVAKRPLAKKEEGDRKVAFYITDQEVVIVGESGFENPKPLVATIRQKENLEAITARLEAPSVNLFQLYFAVMEDSRSRKHKNKAQKMEG